MDLVIGGDKGQEKFCVLIKLLIKNIRNEVVYSLVRNIRHIDIEYNNCEMLKKTLGPALNKSLENIKNKLLVFTE